MRRGRSARRTTASLRCVARLSGSTDLSNDLALCLTLTRVQSTVGIIGALFDRSRDKFGEREATEIAGSVHEFIAAFLNEVE